MVRQGPKQTNKTQGCSLWATCVWGVGGGRGCGSGLIVGLQPPPPVSLTRRGRGRWRTRRKGPLPGWPASGRFQPVLLREHPKGRLVLKREAEAVQLRPGWPGIPDEMLSRTPAGLRAWMCSNRCPFHCSPCLASPAPIFRGHKIGKYGELESTWKSPGPSQHFLECHSVPGPEDTTTVHNHNQY